MGTRSAGGSSCPSSLCSNIPQHATPTHKRWYMCRRLRPAGVQPTTSATEYAALHTDFGGLVWFFSGLWGGVAQAAVFPPSSCLLLVWFLRGGWFSPLAISSLFHAPAVSGSRNRVPSVGFATPLVWCCFLLHRRWYGDARGDGDNDGGGHGHALSNGGDQCSGLCFLLELDLSLSLSLSPFLRSDDPFLRSDDPFMWQIWRQRNARFTCSALRSGFDISRGSFSCRWSTALSSQGGAGGKEQAVAADGAEGRGVQRQPAQGTESLSEPAVAVVSPSVRTVDMHLRHRLDRVS